MNESRPKDQPFYVVIGEIVGLWTILNIGYYFLFPLFGINVSYNSSPISIGLYLFVWVMICSYYFRDIYKKWLTFDAPLWYYVFISLSSVGIFFGSLYWFSFFPSFQGPFTYYTDLVFATPWYFLPKSIEILVQQLLIVVLVLELEARFHTLKDVIIGYAVCFGGAHVILFWLDGVSRSYALLMSVSALLTSFVFPKLILKVHGGFVYAYMIHFIFYMILAAVFHVWPVAGYLI